MKANVEPGIKEATKIAEKRAIEESERNEYNPETGELKKITGTEKLNTEIVWSGEPKTKYKRTKYDWLFIPLSWFIVFVALFWMIALQSNKILYIFAVLLLLFGLYCVFFRNHMKKRKRAKYSYEITETDLTIIYSKKKNVVVRQLPLENIRYIAYTFRKNGVGTIYFNFPNDYKDLFKLVFANSGLGKFDEKIFVFFEIEDADSLIEDFKSKFKDKVRFDQI